MIKFSSQPPRFLPVLVPRSNHYFKYIKISALALLKMVMHARSGGNLEVMGLLIGKVSHPADTSTGARVHGCMESLQKSLRAAASRCL